MMELCEVCHLKERRYVCPGCAMKTCSLPCVKAHKQNTSCDGKRKLSTFVKLENFTDKELLDDMNFLESTSRKIRCIEGGSFRVPTAPVAGGLINSTTSARCSKVLLDILVRAAAMRKVSLKLSPFLTTRRKRNSTHCGCRSMHRLNDRTKMFWHIQWVCESHRFDQKSVNENLLLGELLRNLRHLAEKQLKSAVDDACLSETCTFVSSFSSLCEVDEAAELKIGMLAEHLNKKNAVYILDNTLSIRDNLAGKTVVEHPVFIIIPADKLSDYHQIDCETQR